MKKHFKQEQETLYYTGSSVDYAIVNKLWQEVPEVHGLYDRCAEVHGILWRIKSATKNLSNDSIPE